MTTAPRPRRAPLPRRVLFGLGALVAIASLSCSSASSQTNGAPFASTAVSTPGVTPTTSTPPVPDQLADPAVGPGECKVVMYNPPDAKEKFPGELCRPKENQRDVAVIVIHGGSGISGSYASMRRWANRYLVEGYVTFLPEYHLFNVGGETPVFPKPEQNIKAAVQFLRGTGNAIGIRKDRIVVQGQSAGSRIGAVAFTTPDDPYFAGPERYEGISDRVNGFIGFYHPYDGTMQYADQYFGGPEASKDPKVAERIAKGDSLAHAQNALGPALFITGSKDWSIINVQQDAFADVLHLKLLAATTSVVEGGAHGFDEGGSRLSKLGEQSAVQTLQWLNDNFPQVPTRAPQSVDADVANAPTYSGAVPTTYQPRPTPPGGYSNRPSGGGGVNNAGGGAVTTMAPTTAPDSPTTSTAPTTISTPTTSTPPPPSTAPTTTPKPTTTPAPTTPPTTAAGP